jgi:cobalt-zinc-cadmium efflux system membrane fusion protein
MKIKIGFIILSLIAGTAACRHGGHHEAGEAKDQAANFQLLGSGTMKLSPESAAAAGIKIEKAVMRECQAQRNAMGKTITPVTHKAIVSYAFPARIAELHVSIGDWVKKGQPLVTLESEEVGKALSEFYKCTADSELARTNYEREKSLFQNDVVARKSFLTAESQYKVAQACLEAAEKKLHVLGFSEEQVQEISTRHRISPRITLFSPLSGKVAANDIVIGKMTEPSSELLTIIDPSLLWVDAEIYEKDLPFIAKGQQVDIHIPAFPQETFSGEISYIGDILNEETRTITIRTEVKNPKGLLKPGMFAELRILWKGNRLMLAVPAEAVLEDKDKKIVFVKEDGVYVRREVVTGVRDNGTQEILKGLREGEWVVVQGNHQLKSMLSDALREEALAH